MDVYFLVVHRETAYQGHVRLGVQEIGKRRKIR